MCAAGWIAHQAHLSLSSEDTLDTRDTLANQMVAALAIRDRATPSILQPS